MKRIVLLLSVLLFWTLAGSLSKIAFLTFHSGLYASATLSDWLQVVAHGMRLDVAVAGYISMIAVLPVTVSVWWRGRWMPRLWAAVFFLVSLTVAVAVCVNIGLYSYWGFPLDATPLLYIRTSPSDALASLTLWQTVGWGTAIAVSTLLLFALFMLMTRRLTDIFAASACRRKDTLRSRMGETSALLLFAALLVIPIRGGLSTGTNHTGNVYYSTDIRLNHAAVNPLFCFIESVTHQQNIAGRYRFMDDAEASRLFSGMTYTALRTDTAGVPRLAVHAGSPARPNVIIVVLESFSRYIMTEAGHVSGVTPCLDSLTREGIYFTRFYANSFRTDRALVSVLSGLPAQPTMSIMDLPKKSNALPSIARSLSAHGYSTAFYYGGDTGYSNMRSYLMATGYTTVVSETDFPKALRTGKWGVADGPLYGRVAADVRQAREPFFMTVLSGSSHEPFDVPYRSHIKSPELNAFRYADQCLGDFVSELRRQKAWDNTLLVILPDHLGAYPVHPDNYALWRYELPLVMTGGAVRERRRVETVCCQTDLPATLLALLGIDHGDFTYSRDIFDPRAPHFAFFTLDDGMGMVTPETRIIHDNHASRLMLSEGRRPDSLLLGAKAYLQKLYDDIAR